MGRRRSSHSLGEWPLSRCLPGEHNGLIRSGEPQQGCPSIKHWGAGRVLVKRGDVYGVSLRPGGLVPSAPKCFAVSSWGAFSQGLLEKILSGLMGVTEGGGGVWPTGRAWNFAIRASNGGGDSGGPDCASVSRVVPAAVQLLRYTHFFLMKWNSEPHWWHFNIRWPVYGFIQMCFVHNQSAFLVGKLTVHLLGSKLKNQRKVPAAHPGPCLLG